MPAPLRLLARSHHIRSNYLWRHQRRFEEFGIRCVTDPPADLCYLNGSAADIEAQVEASSLPVALEVMYDTAQFKPQTAYLLGYDKVRMLLRNSGYRDPACYTYHGPGTDYHTRFIARALGMPHPVSVSPVPAHLDKCAVCLPLINTPLRWGAPAKPWAARLVDLHLLMTERYDDYAVPYVSSHRRSAGDAAAKLHSVCSVIYRGDPEQLYRPGLYTRLMQESRMVLSPWGWSGWSARDYEALLYGCVLLKPDTSWLLTSPDIYGPQSACCVTVAADFSDLQQRVDEILARPQKVHAEVLARRTWFLREMTPVAIIRRWADAILARA